MYREMHPESSSCSTVYGISPARLRTLQLGYGIAPVIIGVMLTMLFCPPLLWSQMAPIDFKVQMVLISTVLFTYNLLLFLDRTRLRLVTSPEGISYNGMGYRIFTPWENVAGITVRTVTTEWGGSRRQITGLALYSPAPIITAHFWARPFFGWRDASPTFIPISDFAGYGGGELSREIQSHAPTRASDF